VEAPEGVMRLTRIRLRYHLKVPPGMQEAALRALAVFERGCPVAQTLKGCVALEHSWEMVEEPVQQPEAGAGG